MKSSFTLLLALLTIFLAGLTPGSVVAQSSLVSKWEKVGPVNFTALVHQSPTRIVATTDHGYLYITDDDGTTWRRECVDDTCSLDGIAYGDSLHGALIATGNLLLTSDGGATWHRQAAPVQGSIAMVGALGADTLFVGAPTFPGGTLRGNIFRSTDAGKNWDTVFVTDSAIIYWQAPMKIVFYFGNGYAIGHNFYAKTTDGGAHWASQYLSGEIRDIDFYDAKNGAIASTSGYYVTSDGGAHWAFTPEFHDERDDNYTTVKFFSPTSFFMFGTPNAYLYTSNDLGASVGLVQMRQASSISNVIRTHGGDWLAVGGGIDAQGLPYGGGGVIMRGSVPENATTPVWTVLSECPFGSGVSFHSTKGATLACVAGSYPLISTDSGIFWHVTDQHSPDYGAMHFSSPDTGYLFYTGGSPDVYGGVNLRTVDSGHSWKPVDISPGYMSAAIFGSRDTGYGIYGLSLMRTTDAGLHWQPDSILFSTACPYAGYKVYHNSMIQIASPDGLHAFVTVRVSDTLIVQPGKEYYDNEKIHFAIYKTSDGGASWITLKNIPTLQQSPGLYFRNSSLGFLTCDSGRVYRTSDGGNTWMLEKLAADKYTFNAVNFLNDRVGFLTVDSQAVLATTDAGLTWSWFTIPTNRQEIYDASTIFIDGQDTLTSRSGMSTQGIFFPDPNTVLISFTRTLLNIPAPKGQLYGVNVADYGFYRAKLNLPASSVTESPQVTHGGLSLSLYPNPARDDLRVRIPAQAEAIASLDILDVLGRIVLHAQAATTADYSFDLHSLPSGVYTVRCKSGSQSVSRMFTIER